MSYGLLAQLTIHSDERHQEKYFFSVLFLLYPLLIILFVLPSSVSYFTHSFFLTSSFSSAFFLSFSCGFSSCFFFLFHVLTARVLPPGFCRQGLERVAERLCLYIHPVEMSSSNNSNNNGK
jgi:hypothetical protein